MFNPNPNSLKNGHNVARNNYYDKRNMARTEAARNVANNLSFWTMVFFLATCAVVGAMAYIVLF